MKKKYNRRNFLGTASCAAIGSTTFFSTLFNLGSMSAMSAQQMLNADEQDEDYRAMVCILLAGGNDSYNMLVPVDDQGYRDYQITRSNLALNRNNLLKLNPKTYNKGELGLHPSMPELYQLFQEEKLAFISNVGTLVEPTIKQNIDNYNANLPLGLFSHSDQVQQWQTSVPQSRNANGWGGRIADLLRESNLNNNISMNISLSGRNIFQTGLFTTEYSILPNGTGSVGIAGFENNDFFNQVRTKAVKNLMEKQYQDVFRQSYADIINFSQNTHELFSKEIGDTSLTTPFSQNYVAQSLQMIARTIKARQSLGMKRQTFFLSYQGWDHHDEVINNQQEMLAILSQSMAEFQKAMQELGVEDKVTTFVISDFGRTLSSNGNGTDHAWGGNTIVMGGAVKGKEIYGTYPSLALNNELEIGGGVLIPTIATDEYFAELALWYGVPKSDLSDIFPNIGNFYDTQSQHSPLGFMSI